MKLQEKVWSKIPYLKELVEKGDVKRFTDNEILDLTEGNKLKIKEMEETNKSINLKIIAVLDQTAHFPDESVNMTSYVYMDSQTKPWIIEGDAIGFFANVINEAWFVEEIGSIGIKELPSGFIRRVM